MLYTVFYQSCGASPQDLDDGAYHEEEEQADCLSLKVQNIVALEWATSHSLGLGSNDYTPALLVHAIKSTSGVPTAPLSAPPSPKQHSTCTTYTCTSIHCMQGQGKLG